MPSPENDTAAPPAILIGGADNLVAAARRLVANGIRVVTVAEDTAPGHRVRGVRPSRVGDEVTTESIASWFAEVGSRWEGSVLIPLGDAALRYTADNYAALSERFLPTRMKPEIMRAMLDKQRTVELALSLGISVPQQWSVTGPEDIDEFREDVLFPVLVKPRATYELVRRTGRKFLRAADHAQLRSGVEELADLPGGIVVLEFVPGPDDRLSSYNALRHEGTTIVEYTKRVFRRHPRNEGPATLHQMIHLESTMQAGRRFFEGLGLEGVGNVEFKLDQRDGNLKLIECNHRMTASLALAHRSGIDLATMVYQQARGIVDHTTRGTAEEAWYWYPYADLKAARQISTTEILDWATTVRHRPGLPYLEPRDPGPALQNTKNWGRGVIGRRLGA